MTSSFRLSLVAAFAVCLAIASAGSSAVRYLPPSGSPARRHSRRSGGRSRRRGRARAAHQPTRGGASPGQRPDRGIGERRAPARGAVAEVPPGRGIPIRRSLRGRPAGPDVAEAPLTPASRASLQGREGRTRSIPTPIRTRPARRAPLGTTAPSAPLVRESPAPLARRRPQQARRSNSARGQRPPPLRRNRADRGRLRRSDARSAARAVQCRAASLSGRAISRGGDRI